MNKSSQVIVEHVVPQEACEAYSLDQVEAGMEEVDVPIMPDPAGVGHDDPVFYTELDRAVARANKCQDYTAQLQTKMKALVQAAEEHRRACHDLAMLLSICSHEFKLKHTGGDDEPLKACSQILKEVDNAFAESTSTMSDVVDDRLDKTIQKFSTLTDCHEQMIQSHNKYTTTMTKFCATGFGDIGSAVSVCAREQLSGKETKRKRW